MPTARSAAFLAATAALAALSAQDEPGSSGNRPGIFVAEASAEAREQIATFRVAPGLEVELVAAEPDLCNAVCFQVDERGRIWVVETFRINDGVFDTRNYMQWKDEDLACLTVEDRVAMYRRHIADKIPSYDAFPERIRLLVDQNGDGVMDRSTVFADSFTDLACGIASGVLAVGEDVWLTNIPKLWRLRDRDGDGVADQQVAVSDGWGVHVSLIGHDMHGLIVGPDRRLYFSIGDRGFKVTTKEGEVLDHPHEGAVLRCELDGSGLEVFHRGLRNPQELAFDDRGDLFTGDNNSDGGDQARFVFVAEAGDSGWRIGHQWLSDRGHWNREKLWWPPFPGQAAWIVPPIANVGDGPSGLVYDTGLGLPERYRGHFFLCDFRGGASNSGVRALSLHPKGAGFELASMQQPIWRVLCTDVDIGPDGSLYVLDWVDGWTKTGKGRIYRLRAPEARNDLRLRSLAKNLAADFTRVPEATLVALLDHDDRRLRQKAQFALVDRGARQALATAAKGPDRARARLHAIWGLGILARADVAALEPVVALLKDGHAEVRAQTAKVLGDAQWSAMPDELAARVRDDLCHMVRDDVNSRPRFQAATTLGRLGAPVAEAAVPALLELLAENGDRDPWLRHAASAALANIGDRGALHGAVGDRDPAVRMGVLLALRRLRDPELQSLLVDGVAVIRTEAARAILDADVALALPALAAMADAELDAEEPFVWRALNANRIVGTPECGARLVAFAQDARAPSAMRVEAIEILAEWPAPHGQDRVVGNWRPVSHPDHEQFAAATAAALPSLLGDADDRVARAAAEAAGRLALRGAGDDLLRLLADRGRSAATREAALSTLDQLDARELDAAVERIEADAPGRLRERAVRIFARRNPAKAVPVLESLLQNGSLREKKGAFAALGDLSGDDAAQSVALWLDRLAAGEVDQRAELELLEAAGQRSESAVKAKLAAREAALPEGDPLAAFRTALHGGDAGAGRGIFFDHEGARCQRCHSVGDRGGAAGPKLDDVGKRLDREQLLRSLLEPSAAIADGFGTVVINLHSGDTVAGVVVKDQDGAVEVMDVDGNSKQVPWDRIKERKGSATSAMPPVGSVLSRRQLRDVVEFLARQKG